MRDECPNCRPSTTCASCLDFIHTAHRANGEDHRRGCVRCEARPANRAERRRGRR